MYYICDSIIDPNDTTHKTIDVKEAIEDSKAIGIIESFSFLGKLDYLSSLLEISTSNGFRLLNFVKVLNLKKLIFEEKKECSQVITEANRYAMNFCVSSRIFLDRSTDLVKKNKSSEISALEGFISSQYDNNFAYRFFYKLRNCIVHDRLPFSIINLKLPDFVELGCSKSNLLSFEKWGSVRPEIEKLSDIIHIEEYVIDFGSSLYAIYLKCVYAFRYDILEAHAILHSLEKEFELKNPTILIGNMDTQEINNVFTFHYNLLWKTTEDLKKHPGVLLESFD